MPVKTTMPLLLRSFMESPAFAQSWFDGVHSDLAKVSGAQQRSQALEKLGLLKRTDFKDFNRLLKKSPGWSVTPANKDALVKSEHRRKIIDAKLKYIRKTALPSQKKRQISGDAGEVERLMTVLYYETHTKMARDATGRPGDVSDYGWLLMVRRV